MEHTDFCFKLDIDLEGTQLILITLNWSKSKSLQLNLSRGSVMEMHVYGDEFQSLQIKGNNLITLFDSYSRGIITMLKPRWSCDPLMKFDS